MRMSFLYFAFGSNLLRQRLRLNNPSATFVSTARLEGYRLAFSNMGLDPRTMRWRGGAATIVDAPGHAVWGCVWRLDNEHRESLDRQESVYNAIEVPVTAPDNTVYTCLTYQLPKDLLSPRGFDPRPSPMYLDVIVRGAVQNHLPGSYIDQLNAVQHNGLHEDIDLYTHLLRMLNDDL
ncbi:gamma-glutamylcyclotransferase-like [Dreissena polymorpha]|uniref:gamma-glutamylcyclotransferase n=1 Tax=Dreissena polymorpha TaxID=45954 RepID=A0A9D4EBR8_DREPO|nr:gamma-glutamylcyclotransferase-like [Dreissena polymorpha]XP_052232008.1 gamma-glutamylcyclotransferase-like [Dreissena polymorpha]KAH3776380.1 hypothetical protein DPMN_177803 [Dreissena polymorpha]